MYKQKPAYLVASSFMLEGHGSLDVYGRAVYPLLEKYGGELLVAGSTDQFMDHFEGEWNDGARFTLFRFPSMEALQSFWHSDEYQSAKLFERTLLRRISPSRLTASIRRNGQLNIQITPTTRIKTREARSLSSSNTQ